MSKRELGPNVMFGRVVISAQEGIGAQCNVGERRNQLWIHTKYTGESESRSQGAILLGSTFRVDLLSDNLLSDSLLSNYIN